jgi:hypothetical protein
MAESIKGLLCDIAIDVTKLQILVLHDQLHAAKACDSSVCSTASLAYDQLVLHARCPFL